MSDLLTATPQIVYDEMIKLRKLLNKAIKMAQNDELPRESWAPLIGPGMEFVIRDLENAIAKAKQPESAPRLAEVKRLEVRR